METRTALEPRTTGVRFDDWSRPGAIAALVLVSLVMVIGVLLGGTPTPDTSKVPESRTDLALYTAVMDRVQHGDGYYTAAAAEQRERGYPLRPAMTMREPTLTYMGAALGGVKHLRIAISIAGVVVVLGMIVKLEKLTGGGPKWWSASVLTALASVWIFVPKSAVFHEAWAVLFILLALLVRRPGRSVLPSVVLGFLAVAVREIAFPFVAVMAFLAWREGRIREFWQWVCAGTIFLATYAIHYGLVLSHTTGADPQSQGWLELGGWPFALSTVRQPSMLSLLPFWVTALLVPLALLGWASIRNAFAIRIFTMIAVFLAIFTVVGRPENWYWGVLFVPMLGAGLAFAPAAIWTLCRRSLRPMRIPAA